MTKTFPLPSNHTLQYGTGSDTSSYIAIGEHNGCLRQRPSNGKERNPRQFGKLTNHAPRKIYGSLRLRDSRTTKFECSSDDSVHELFSPKNMEGPKGFYFTCVR